MLAVILLHKEDNKLTKKMGPWLTVEAMNLGLLDQVTPLRGQAWEQGGEKKPHRVSLLSEETSDSISDLGPLKH